METNIKTNVEQEKLVLYLDIMGFKERVNRVKAEKLKKQLLQFKTKNNKLKPLLEVAKTNKTLIEMAQFSDSIVLVSPDTTIKGLNRICRAATILMQTALQSGFALRGAIAKGKMVFDKNNQLFFGKALVDAYLLEEELCYYGIVFHESMEKITLTALNSELAKKTYIPIEDIEVPLKKGKSKHYHIAWHTLQDDLRKGDITNEALGWLRSLRETVSGNPRVYLDNTRKILEEKQNETV